MKRFLLPGLFVAASVIASTSFADNKPADLCEASIQRINNASTQYQTSPDLNARVSASVQKAKDLKNRGMIDECVAETQQTLLDIQNATADTKK